MTYALRLGFALRDHWKRILLGSATGLYVAFGVCLGVMIVAVAHGDRWSDVTLALVMDAVLMAGMLGGAIAGYATRREPAPEGRES